MTTGEIFIFILLAAVVGGGIGFQFGYDTGFKRGLDLTDKK